MENQMNNNKMNTEETVEKLDSLLRHIHNVSANCNLLGKRLIREGEAEMGKILIAFGLTHDHSKFFGIEWDNLHPDSHDCEDTNTEEMKLAINHHSATNRHHPQFWGGIKLMPDVHIAEMVCDIKSRASEFGTDVRDWIDNVATKRYKFSKNDDVYKKIQRFLNLLLEKPFK